MFEMRFAAMSYEQRKAFVGREEVKNFLAQIRAMKDQERGVSNGSLLIPEVMLPLVYSEIKENSQLLPYVNETEVSGTAVHAEPANVCE